MAADQHGHPDRDRQIGLAGAGRADAEGQFVLEKVAHIGFLRLGARFDLLLAGADLDPARGEHLKLVLDAGGGGNLGAAHADRRVDLAGVDAAPGLQPTVEGLQQRRHLPPGLCRTDHRQVIAASQDMNPKLMLYLGQIAVELAAQVDQQPVVGKFQKGLVQILGTRRRGQGANAQAGLL